MTVKKVFFSYYYFFRCDGLTLYNSFGLTQFQLQIANYKLQISNERISYFIESFLLSKITSGIILILEAKSYSIFNL